MFDQLQRAINLAQKTGDKLIVFDSRNPKNSYVLIPFDEYEQNMLNELEDFEDDEVMNLEGDDELFWKNTADNQSDIDFSELSFDNDNKGENDSLTLTDSHLTEEERIDKINRDLSSSKDDDLLDENIFDKKDFLEGNFDRNSDSLEDRSGKSSHWNISKNIKEVAEEVVEEDRHYLEEITF